MKKNKKTKKNKVDDFQARVNLHCSMIPCVRQLLFTLSLIVDGESIWQRNWGIVSVKFQNLLSTQL